MNRSHYFTLALTLFAICARAATVPMKEVVDCFAGKNNVYFIAPFFGPVRLIEINEGGRTLRFFGIHKDQQASLDFAGFKQAVMARMGINSPRMLEVIGDSNQFSKEGTVNGRRIIAEHCAGNHLIEYGYTGHDFQPDELDVNALVNEYVNQQPAQGQRVLANVVGHTHLALTDPKFGCTVIPYISNFVVVYNDNGMEGNNFTKFGDDVTVSDFVLDPATQDCILCLEGGVQSFKQVTTALLHGCSVYLVTGLRKQIPGKKGFFSTAEFFNRIRNAYQGAEAPSKERVEAIYQEYNSCLASTWDPNRADAKTKQALFDKAISEFINQEVYKSIKDQCIFVH